MFDEVVKWHKQAFPVCTKQSQVIKLEEELEEFYKDGFSDKELADVLIVAIVLSIRFNSYIGKDILARYYTADKDSLIKEKLEINKRRKWLVVNGTFHH